MAANGESAAPPPRIGTDSPPASDFADAEFHELLLKLGRHHESQVRLLHNEIENLRGALACTKAQSSLRDVGFPRQCDEPSQVLEETIPVPTSPKIFPEGAGKTPISTPPAFPLTPHSPPAPDAKELAKDEASFALKNDWVNMPEASGTWGLELDKLMVNQVAHQKGPGPRGSEISQVATVPKFSCGDVRKRLIINPSSQKRVIWDLSGMILIAYDIIAIPITLCFNPPEHWFTTFMGWTTLIFWSTDVFCSVFTGYFEDGNLIMQQTKIIRQYLKFWFWIDMLVVIPDWVMKFLGSTTNAAGLGRVLRIARVMRVLRMLRLLKLKRLFSLVYDCIDSEYMWIVISLIKLLMLLLVMNHLVACLWYLVGRMGRDSNAPKNWLQDAGMTHVDDTDDLTFKYLTCLHWSITQFTPASMDISATNSLERAFSVAILFWALVALSSVIGNVSAGMTALRQMGSDEMQKFWMLRRYFKQKAISRQLADRIVKYLEYEVDHKKDVVARDKVKLLSDVSENLMLELANEMHAPTLKVHPFWLHIDLHIRVMMFRLCHDALIPKSYAEDDHAFDSGDAGQYMFFIKSGSYKYELVDGMALDTSFGAKTWAAEAILWTEFWRHRGTLTAEAPGEITLIVPDKFSNVMRMHPRPWNLARDYGAQFVEYMNHVNRTGLTDIFLDENIFDKLLSVGVKSDKIPSENGNSATIVQAERKGSDKLAWA